ncbi:Acetyl esterase/lipase [Rhodococcus maanshanensis]|uniref:Acetyl esterase/lipase n=1 Tax=Rhodococcus maanshanensis TaxID=183556 RepID=A0A1H7TRD0_9NOCA|nr:alpha/beta hydrolase [Rhodococcus maanshanensis]SEL86936.1 Acetyl esterase/lipase [Rhodococcus maanshanensis]
MVFLPRPLVAANLGAFYRVALHAKMPVPAARALLDAGSPLQRLPRDTVVRELTLASRRAERITVGASERRTAVLYLHGGGFTLGSLATHRSLAAYLARESGAAVYLLDYRLAPENPYPAGLEDAVDAYLELLVEHGYTADRVAIAGDSAGGGLSLATARRLIDTHDVRPAALALIAPWVDPGARNAPKDRDLVINTEWSFIAAEAYLGGGDPADPGFAPLQGDMAGLPPTIVHVGTSEVLYPQVVELVDKLRAAGVTVEFTEYPRLWHVAHLQASILREANDAVRELGGFLGAALDRTEV